MIKIKHLMDGVEAADGKRIWIEPIGLTKDLQAWCAVHRVLCHLGPPVGLWEWFSEHPDGYGYFRGTYHEHLGAERNRAILRKIASVARREDITLLHQGEDSSQNTATALYEYLSNLEGYLPRE